MNERTETRGQKAAAFAARVAVALVFVINVQCAVLYVVHPEAYVAGFELPGEEGVIAVRGLGVAFLMWNATYPAVIANPQRFRALYVVVLVQQVIGVVGESWIRLTLPANHAALAATINRFITFDAAGLILMTATFIILKRMSRSKKEDR
ncbi:hypothetical protein [Gordonibacter sp.]|uniref:hypothetical protein n=1 Tax=Gordonibacter sp. TaxID=1968902 RepID=UPI001FA55569|nr:hypothetical protein [Gordonibacter sp.]HIW75985.1 hypothetical protein [Candidatus Gordonibacter avicola]